MTLAIGISITRVNVGEMLYQGFKIHRYVTLNVRFNLDIKAVQVYRSNFGNWTTFKSYLKDHKS